MSLVSVARINHSRPQSLRSIWPAAGIERLWEQPFQACAIDEDYVRPDGQNSVISFVFSKWLLPELSIPAAGQKDRRLWGREWINTFSIKLPKVSSVPLPHPSVIPITENNIVSRTFDLSFINYILPKSVFVITCFISKYLHSYTVSTARCGVLSYPKVFSVHSWSDVQNCCTLKIKLEVKWKFL